MKPDLKEAENHFHSLNLRGKLHELHEPVIMGIINLTPDSFYAPSRVVHNDALLRQAESMILQGAFCLDLGAASSRPGAVEITPDEELRRLISAVENISKHFPEIFISVDTFYGSVAAEAVAAGAHIINDITGGEDELILKVAAENSCPYIAMHKKGVPKDMQLNPHYDNVLLEVMEFFIRKIPVYRDAGIKDIIIDPGFGFGKSLQHNYTLLKNLSSFHTLDCPVLAGISRKSMITKALNVSSAGALNGTTALHMLALTNGAMILRAHDVKEAVECVRLFQYYQTA